jgi:NAD(P)-dependent dehydrogenase (short-subunit alcohol dehydrogenase family)
MKRPAVIVTGAAGGLGRQAIMALQHRAVDVTCFDVAEGDLGTLIDSFGPCAARFQILTGDLGNEESVRSVIASVRQEWGGLDGIFNTAAVLGTPARMIDVDTAVFDAVMATNVRGTWLIMKYGIPLMIARGGGAIVNVGSYNAIRGGSGIAAYTGSKHAVVGMTKSVALEYAQDQIRANILSPGSMNSAMITSMFPLHGRGDPELGREIVLSRIPQRRLAEPAEVASMGVWLLLDAPTHLTGQVITIDGGRSAG